MKTSLLLFLLICTATISWAQNSRRINWGKRNVANGIVFGTEASINASSMGMQTVTYRFENASTKTVLLTWETTLFLSSGSKKTTPHFYKFSPDEVKDMGWGGEGDIVDIKRDGGTVTNVAISITKVETEDDVINRQKNQAAQEQQRAKEQEVLEEQQRVKEKKEALDQQENKRKQEAVREQEIAQQKKQENQRKKEAFTVQIDAKELKKQQDDAASSQAAQEILDRSKKNDDAIMQSLNSQIVGAAYQMKDSQTRKEYLESVNKANEQSQAQSEALVGLATGLFDLFSSDYDTWKARQEVKSENFYQKGKEYFDKKNYKKAKSYFEKSAEKHNQPAKFMLGSMYYYGMGVAQDYTKSRSYYSETYKIPTGYFMLGEWLCCMAPAEP